MMPYVVKETECNESKSKTDSCNIFLVDSGFAIILHASYSFTTFILAQSVPCSSIILMWIVSLMYRRRPLKFTSNATSEWPRVAV